MDADTADAIDSLLWQAYEDRATNRAADDAEILYQCMRLAGYDVNDPPTDQY